MTTPTESYERLRAGMECHIANALIQYGCHEHKALSIAQEITERYLPALKPPAQQPEQVDDWPGDECFIEMILKATKCTRDEAVDLFDELLPNLRPPTTQPTAQQPAQGAEVELRDCPPGLFEFQGSYGFKSEYHSVEIDGFAKTDAYCLESGEYFWGGCTSKYDREKLLVRPVTGIPAALSHPLTPAEREEAVRVMAEAMELADEQFRTDGRLFSRSRHLSHAALAALESKGYVGRKG